jgi:hypothetical protein
MEGTQKPHTDNYEDITNDWNYDASYVLTSLVISDFENFKHLIFCYIESTWKISRIIHIWHHC